MSNANSAPTHTTLRLNSLRDGCELNHLFFCTNAESRKRTLKLERTEIEKGETLIGLTNRRAEQILTQICF